MELMIKANAARHIARFGITKKTKQNWNKKVCIEIAFI